MPHEDVETRFWRKVQFTETCWLWQANINNHGYGQFMLCRRRPIYAHRLAFMLVMGPIPADLTIDHLCRTRCCVNPLHLEPVTMRENTLRGNSNIAIHARKTHCVRGHPFEGHNLYLRPDGGGRVCRACMYARNRRYQAKPLH